MPDVTLSEFLRVLLPLIVLGLYTADEEIRARRWDPQLFRTGICLFRSSVPLAHPPDEVPMPPFGRKWIWSTNRASRLAANEVGFFMPTLNGPVMRGLLRYDQVANSLEVVGHLQMGVWVLLAFGCLLAGFLLAWPLLAGLLAWAYWGEREAFQGLLVQTAARIVPRGKPTSSDQRPGVHK